MATLLDLCKLPLPNNTYTAEYVWIDAYDKLRSKGRTLTKRYNKPTDFPKWNYDGSSTGQAPGSDSEVILYPQAVFWDPFRGKPNVLVMCDTYTPGGEPLPTNARFNYAKVMKKAVDKGLEPWFGIEQEYFLFEKDTQRPKGYPDLAPQGPYYCGVSAVHMQGRLVAEAHYRACLYAGISLSGINAEVAPGQWEYQVGVVKADAGDQVWMARYIMERIAEEAGLSVNLEPKPMGTGDWNGSGAHTNFSTKPMREDGGYEKAIIPALERLSKKHKEHIAVYGKGNDARLTGKHETASIDVFRYGTADRGASCRVGHETKKDGKGYFEDRRPAGNMDPYLVCMMILSTSCDIPID
eukprot:CAMPEP_0184693428 /NCGR_PEP_ID=MMETSP0313-20130426/1655_1 /TAXON_ID=2792 /ORGANISM="Porphyridium aerugineum, Strain SAG 1380-2" /LENGTH=352 /DNA_ID=CAMNT_0027151511 /DNA_START=53 /DNA_END=1111 /DNA_ORIENTATION=-